MVADIRYAICDGLAEEINDRWPQLQQIRVECASPIGGTYSQLQLRMPDECGYSCVHIMCDQDIFVDADGDYGPQMKFNYADSDCVDNVLAFILAILSSKRTEAGLRLSEDTVNLPEWRRKL